MTLAMKVMLDMMLGYNAEQTYRILQPAIGRNIVKLYIEDNRLSFLMDNGKGFHLLDDGQSCCESRYMTTDDSLEHFVGATLTGIEVRKGPLVEDEWADVHDTEFLLVHTSKGTFTVVNHNEHNGYYGGFSLLAVPMEQHYTYFEVPWAAHGRVPDEVFQLAMEAHKKGYYDFVYVHPLGLFGMPVGEGVTGRRVAITPEML